MAEQLQTVSSPSKASQLQPQSGYDAVGERRERFELRGNMMFFRCSAQFFADALSGTNQAREYMQIRRLLSIAITAWLIVASGIAGAQSAPQDKQSAQQNKQTPDDQNASEEE